MSWLSKIQSKPREEKIRLIWIIIIIIVVILVALWILVGSIDNPGKGKSNFIKDFNDVLKNTKDSSSEITKPVK